MLPNKKYDESEVNTPSQTNSKQLEWAKKHLLNSLDALESFTKSVEAKVRTLCLLSLLGGLLLAYVLTLPFQDSKMVLFAVIAIVANIPAMIGAYLYYVSQSATEIKASVMAKQNIIESLADKLSTDQKVTAVESSNKKQSIKHRAKSLLPLALELREHGETLGDMDALRSVLFMCSPVYWVLLGVISAIAIGSLAIGSIGYLIVSLFV